MNHKVTITPEAATGPGALPGFAVYCAACGFVGSSSLGSIARADAQAHVAYMEREGR